jgi:predicted  nucleic acid-binding Zn-ribbon protein
MDEEINRLSQQVRSLKEQIEVLQDAHMHEIARANALAHDLAITQANLESLRASIIAACAGTGCLNAHELRQRLDRAEDNLARCEHALSRANKYGKEADERANILAAEVRAWREWWDDEEGRWTTNLAKIVNKRQATDAAKAMEETQ